MNHRLSQISTLQEDFKCSLHVAQALDHALWSEAGDGFGSLSLLKGLLSLPACNAFHYLVNEGVRVDSLSLALCSTEENASSVSAFSLVARTHERYRPGPTSTDVVLLMILDSEETAGSRMLRRLGLDKESLQVWVQESPVEKSGLPREIPDDSSNSEPNCEESDSWDLAYEWAGWALALLIPAFAKETAPRPGGRGAGDSVTRNSLFQAIMRDKRGDDFWLKGSGFYERRFAELAIHYSEVRVRSLPRHVLYAWAPAPERERRPVFSIVFEVSNLKGSPGLLSLLIQGSKSSASRGLARQGISATTLSQSLEEWHDLVEPFAVRVLLYRGYRIANKGRKGIVVRSIHVLIAMTEWVEGFLASGLLRKLGLCPRKLREFEGETECP